MYFLFLNADECTNARLELNISYKNLSIKKEGGGVLYEEKNLSYIILGAALYCEKSCVKRF